MQVKSSFGVTFGLASNPAAGSASPAKASAPSGAVPASGGLFAVTAPTATGPLDQSGIQSSIPLGALESIPASTAAGAVFRLDNGFLDSLRLQVRPLETAEGKPGYTIQFKVAGPSRASMQARLEQKGAQQTGFAVREAKPIQKGGRVVLAETGVTTQLCPAGSSSHARPDGGTGADHGLRLQGSGWTVDYVPKEGPAAARGLVSIRLVGDAATCNEQLQNVVNTLGLQPAFAPVTPTALRRYALMRSLWRMDPCVAGTLAYDGDLSGLKPEKLEAALLERGFSKERMAQLRYEEVAPGHFAVMDDQIVREMKEAGLRYAYSTVEAPEHVLSILRGGQKATLSRWMEGALISGMSSVADLRSGGGQGVFSRLVLDNVHSASWPGRRFKIILKPELLARTDIWGWAGDFYGRSWGLSSENFGVKLVQQIKSGGGGYAAYNEIVSPVANGPQWIAAVVATSEVSRQELIEHLKANAYHAPNGQSLESFIRLAPTMSGALLEDPASPGTSPSSLPH